MGIDINCTYIIVVEQLIYWLIRVLDCSIILIFYCVVFLSSLNKFES